MGWKCSLLIIDSDKDFDEKTLLKNLGFNHIEKTQKVNFSVALNPGAEEVYIGRYKGKIVVCEIDLPSKCMTQSVITQEMLLSKYYFPDTEICSLVLHSVINYWGYAIVKNDEKIRVRAGDTESGLLVEYGKPLEQELELLSKSKLDEQGNKIYFLDDFPDKTFSEDQVGESFVFKMASRYFQMDLDKDDDLYEEATSFQAYRKIDKLKEEAERYRQAERRKRLVILTVVFILILIGLLKVFL